jgi:hypothetical protein
MPIAGERAKKFGASPWEARHESQALLTMSLHAAGSGRTFRSRGFFMSAQNAPANKRQSTGYYPRKPDRRQQCVTALNIPEMPQPTAARSAVEGLASYGITPAEQRFVQRNVLIGSRRVRTVTADGCVDCTPPERG